MELPLLKVCRLLASCSKFFPQFNLFVIYLNLLLFYNGCWPLCFQRSLVFSSWRLPRMRVCQAGNCP
jgi:hypothetical protein